jgi:hypothetical protein
MPPEERQRALQDPEIGAAYRQAKLLAEQLPVDIGSPSTDTSDTGSQDTGSKNVSPFWTRQVPSIISGFAGGFLAGGPAGATIGAGLGAMFPHQGPPWERPGGYLLDIFGPRLGSALYSKIPLASSTPHTLQNVIYGTMKGSMASGTTLTGADVLDWLGGGAKQEEAPGFWSTTLNYLIPVPFEGFSATLRGQRKIPAVIASDVLESSGMKNVPKLMKGPSLEEELIFSPEGSPIHRAYQAYQSAAEDMSSAILEKKRQIDKLQEQIASTQAELQKATGDARARLLEQRRQYEQEQAQARESALRLVIAETVKRHQLDDAMRNIKMGLAPRLEQTPLGQRIVERMEQEGPLVVDYQQIMEAAQQGKISQQELSLIIDAIDRRAIGVILPGIGKITPYDLEPGKPTEQVVRSIIDRAAGRTTAVGTGTTGTVMDSIKNAKTPAELEAIRREVQASLTAGEIDQPEARRLLGAIAEQTSTLVGDIKRAEQVESFVTRLEEVDAARASVRAAEIDRLEQRLREVRMTRPQGDPQADEEVRRLQEQIAEKRVALAQQRGELRAFQQYEPELLREAPAFYQVWKKSAGPGDMIDILLDEKTPDEVLGQALRFLEKKDPDAARAFRRRVTEEFFRQHFQAEASGQKVPVQAGKLFQLYRGLIPEGREAQVLANLRDFVQVANEYAHLGGARSYIEYGARWTIRSLPAILVIASTSTMFPKLAMIGAFAMVLNSSLVLEQIARDRPAGLQFVRWLREDRADPRRLMAYPQLRRFLLEHGTPISESNAAMYTGVRDEQGAPVIRLAEPPGTPPVTRGPSVPPGGVQIEVP